MPIYDSDNPYYVDSAFDSPSTGFVNIDPALRPEGLPPLANCFMDLEGDFVMPLIKCMGGTFYDHVEFRGAIEILDSVTVGTNVNVTDNLLVSGNLDVDGSLHLSSGTRVNSIGTSVGDPGSHDVLVTEAAVRSFVETYVAQVLEDYATENYVQNWAVWARDQAIASANQYTDEQIAALGDSS